MKYKIASRLRDDDDEAHSYKKREAYLKKIFIKLVLFLNLTQ